MSRRSNSHLRCLRCRLHASLCICAHIPKLFTRTRLVLLLHRTEQRKPTNTGLLAVECLQNSELWVRGHAEPMGEYSPDPATLPVVLFPSAGATPLTEFLSAPRPISLIVPDGTWRQASKMLQRVPGLRNLPVVSLPEGALSVYRLRREQRHQGLATMEAIARALGVLEDPSIQQALERVFALMVERTLWSRGELDATQLMSAVPDGVMRHDPRSGTARPSSSVRCPPARTR